MEVSKIWFMIFKVQILYGNKKLSKKVLLRNIKVHFNESFFWVDIRGHQNPWNSNFENFLKLVDKIDYQSFGMEFG